MIDGDGKMLVEGFHEAFEEAADTAPRERAIVAPENRRRFLAWVGVAFVIGLLVLWCALLAGCAHVPPPTDARPSGQQCVRATILQLVTAGTKSEAAAESIMLHPICVDAANDGRTCGGRTGMPLIKATVGDCALVGADVEDGTWRR